MISILHAADLHLDSPFAALDGEQAAAMRKEQRRILEDIAAEAERRRADILLLAGDLFDSSRCFGETEETLLRALEQTRARVFIAPGNHDYYSPRSPWARMKLPENVHVFTSPEIEAVELPGLGCTVYGAAFLSDSAAPPLRGFRAKGDGVNIMLLHGDTENADSKYGYISREDIAESGLDYLALGHIHKFSGIRREGNTFFAYPGAAIGRGFDETGEKGFIAGGVEKGGCSLEFVPVNSRRYEIISVDISGHDAAESIKKSMPVGCGRDIYRVLLTGECETPPNVPALERELSPLCFRLEIRDETRPKTELWAMAGASSLKGGFLRRMKARYDAADTEEERAIISLAARHGLAALEKREEV